MLSQIFKHSFKSLTTKVGFGIKKQPSLSKTENIDGSI